MYCAVPPLDATQAQVCPVIPAKARGEGMRGRTSDFASLTRGNLLNALSEALRLRSGGDAWGLRGGGVPVNVPTCLVDRLETRSPLQRGTAGIPGPGRRDRE